MKPTPAFLPLLLFPLLYAAWYFFQPATIGSIEAEGYFTWTEDYWLKRLSEPGGLTAICAGYLSQYYRWLEAGIALQVAQTGIVFWLCRSFLRAKGGTEGAPVLPATVFALFQSAYPSPGETLPVVGICAALAIYAQVRQAAVRRWILAACPLLLVFFLPAGWILFLYLLLLIADGKAIVREMKLYPFLAGTGIAAILPCAWSRFAAYLPAGERFFPETVGDPLARLLWMAGIALALVAGLHPLARKRWTATAIPVVSCLILLGAFAFSPEMKKREKRTQVMQYAVASQWDSLLGALPSPAEATDPAVRPFLLLALSEKGLMPDNLERLGADSPDCFRFPNPATREERLLNALFYASLDIYNEAIHQIFEIALQSPDGMNFQSLRLLADYFLKAGNVPVAEKYLTLLEHTSCHGSWTARRRDFIRQQGDNLGGTPDESPVDVFIGSYPFLQEVSLLLSLHPEHVRLEEYYLSALLLNGEPERFRDVFNHLPYQKQVKKIPEAYRRHL